MNPKWAEFGWSPPSSADKTLKTWNPATGQCLGTLTLMRKDKARGSWVTDFRGDHARPFAMACAVAPDRSFIVSADASGYLTLWDSATGEEWRACEGHAPESVDGCAVAPDGSFVVSASKDKTLKVWDPATGECLETLTGHTSAVEGCAIAPDGSFAVSASLDRTLKVWRLSTGKEVASIALLGGLDCVALHPSAPLAVCGDLGGGVYLIDLIGIEYGPIIVTATDFGNGLVIRCPHCNKMIPFRDSWKGTEQECPADAGGCGGPWRVNPFVFERRS